MYTEFFYATLLITKNKKENYNILLDEKILISTAQQILFRFDDTIQNCFAYF